MRIHFVGIGGIGVSALARHFIAEGWDVSGSDLKKSEITDELKDEGVRIQIGHDKNNIDSDIEKVVYTAAVNFDNPEIKEAIKMGIKIKSYPQALAEVSKDYFTIAVSGTHGKSTTTAITAMILIEAGFDPTVIVGTKLSQFGSKNYRRGSSQYLIIEADEWNKSILNYSPDLATITNLELEHLDSYSDIDDLIGTFREYLSGLKDKPVILNDDDSNLKKLKVKNRHFFSVNSPIKEEIKKVLKVPGDHNLENALAAYKTAELLKIPKEKILRGIANYEGIWRRFEEKEITVSGQKINIVQDYAHHPTELRATLKALSDKYGEKAVAVFQPHQYKRTAHLRDQFIEVLNESEIKVFVVDIYSVAGRESKEVKKKISSRELVEGVKNEKVDYLPGGFGEIKKKLEEYLQRGKIIAIIGAGDIYRLEEVLKGQIKSKNK